MSACKFNKRAMIARLRLDAYSQEAISKPAYYSRLRDKRKFNREKGACLTLRVSAFCHTYRGTVRKMDGVEAKEVPVKRLLTAGCTK